MAVVSNFLNNNKKIIIDVLSSDTTRESAESPVASTSCTSALVYCYYVLVAGTSNAQSLRPQIQPTNPPPPSRNTRKKPKYNETV